MCAAGENEHLLPSGEASVMLQALFSPPSYKEAMMDSEAENMGWKIPPLDHYSSPAKVVVSYCRQVHVSQQTAGHSACVSTDQSSS